MIKNYLENLNTAVVEKDVENIYRQALLNSIHNASIISPCGSDGILKANNILTLLEAKFNKNLKDKTEQNIILTQCIYYLKKFQQAGEELPTSCFVGDVNECFILDTNCLIKYLKNDQINWNTAPSQAYKSNPELLLQLQEDPNITPFIYEINEKFNLNELIEKLQNIHIGNNNKIKITDKNMPIVFDYFINNVLDSKNKLTPNEQVNLFIQIVVNPSDHYIHPNKKNLLVSKSFGEIKVNDFEAFFKHYEGVNYTAKDKEVMTALSDRLIEDKTRRRKGEFYTPTIWVDEAHKEISKVFGDDWKEKYIVWDPAAGQLNLTRDYNFKELYCSTIEQSDLDTSDQSKFNLNATKFQYDFLNDPYEKLPESLQNAIESGREIIVFMNPPYGRAGMMSARKTTNYSGVSNTMINLEMVENNWGKSAQQLYSQFLYRIFQLNKNNNFSIAWFSPPLYKSGLSFNLFRQHFIKKFKFIYSMIFNAGHFSDTATSWGIDFSIWKSNTSINYNKYINTFLSDIKEIDKTGIKVIKTQTLYNLDGMISANIWIRNEIKKLEKIDEPQLSSFITVQKLGKGKNVKNNIGYFYNHSNNVYYNGCNVGMFSSVFSWGHGIPVIPENFDKVCSLHAARRLIVCNWINCKDEYIAPNENHTEWQQFVNDSIIHALFNKSSQQSSLRQIDYKYKKWDIKNEFFWLSNKEMMQLANDNYFDDMYVDAKQHNNDRYVYNKLKEIKLSDDAQKVLNMATDLLIKSIEKRKALHQLHPEYHLNCWDAGYAQLKLVWKDCFKGEFKAFKEEYKKLEKRLIPLVYELGFLKK